MKFDNEANACWKLRALLADLEVGAAIPDSDELRAYLDSLEFMLPDILMEEHPWWRWEELDGILASVARKTGPREGEVIGLCWLMSGSDPVPISVRVRVARAADEIEWLECKIGERGEDHGGIQRRYSKSLAKRLHLVTQQAPDICWAYTVTVDSRTSE